MRQKMICWIVGLIFGIMPMMGANVTDSPEHLAFGKIWMEGGCRARQVQCMHVEVTNTGLLDYQGWWDVRDIKTGKRLGESDTYGDFNVGEVDVKAGETKDVTIWFFFIQPDSFELSIVSSGTRLFNYTVDIGENVAPKVTGNLRVDMLERTDDGNILYGDYAHFRITGTATLTNEDENTIFAWGGFMDGAGSGIQVAVSPQLFGPYVAYNNLYSLASELKSGQTVTKDFEFEFTATPEDGKEYGIYLDVLGNGVDQILFIVKPCTNTYWTADGHVKPLPVEAGQVLKVPCEALAVDLRGQYEMNTVFSIDTSEANPNCLYFLGYLDNVPQGFTSKTNIIRDYDAKEIIINADDDYYCPMPFKAKTALFTYTPVSEVMGPANTYMSQIMSGTVILPFETQQPWLDYVNDSNQESSFLNEYLRIAQFKGSNGTDLVFEPVTSPTFHSYEPYLIYYIIPSPISFFSEDVTIPSTRKAMQTSQDGIFSFEGSTTTTTAERDTYIWNCDHYCFYLNHEPKQVRPFTAIMHIDTNLINLPDGLPEVLKYTLDSEPGVTSSLITAVNSTSQYPQAVYSLSGQRVGTAEYANGRLSAEGLRPGLYIVGGRKIVVK